MFLNALGKLESNDIFNLNDNNDFVNLIKNFIDKYEIHEVSSIESLVIKLISGDSSDNIPSVWSIVKNGRKRGIAEKGAKSIYDEYIINWGEPNLNDADLAENIADLICEKKRLSKSNIKWIEGNINFNMKLILLDNSQMPENILERMDTEFEKIKK
jgi:5'-3' exonuclease